MVKTVDYSILIIVGVLHLVFCFWRGWDFSSDRLAHTKNTEKRVEVKIQKVQPPTPRKRGGAFTKTQGRPAEQLSFGALSPKLGDDLSFSAGSEGDFDSRSTCLTNLVEAVGSFPRSFFHHGIIGSALVRVTVINDEVSFRLSRDSHWMIGSLLCHQMKERFEQFIGNTCLKNLGQQPSRYSFDFRLVLEIGQDQGEEFLQLSEQSYLKKITRLSKASPVQALKMVSNIFSVADLMETEGDRLEWQRYQGHLSRFDCHGTKVLIRDQS